MEIFHEDKAVAQLAEVVALECGVALSKARKIRNAAVFHDLGKRKLCPKLLSKPGRFTAEEFEVIKTHTTIGAEMLSVFQGELGVMAQNLACWHHEHWDGQGYWGKFLCELPYYIEFVAVADVFISLISPYRTYKRAWAVDEAADYIRSQSGKRFSPAMTEIFVPLVQSNSRAAAIIEPIMRAVPC